MTQPPARYAMISTELRRDSDDPLRLFRNIQVRHFYRVLTAPGGTSGDLGSHVERYSTPWDLAARLSAWQPDVLQGVEPFALITAPYLTALNWYLRSRPTPLITVSLENVPLKTKYGPLGAAVLSPLIRRTIRGSAVVVAVNEGAAQNFLHHGAPSGKIRRMLWGNTGIDLHEFSPDGPRTSFRQSPDEFVIMFVGRVVEAKGIFDLLDAFELVVREFSRPVRLVVVGAGSAASQVERRVRRAGLAERVTLAGPRPNREIAALLRGSDVLVVPSRTTPRWAEQIGMVFVQAMGCGVPVVTTTSGSIPEFVPDGEVGLLVDEAQPGQIAAAILRLLNDPPLRLRLGQQGRTVAAARYDVAKNVKAIEELIQNVACGSRPKHQMNDAGQGKVVAPSVTGDGEPAAEILDSGPLRCDRTARR